MWRNFGSAALVAGILSWSLLLWLQGILQGGSIKISHDTCSYVYIYIHRNINILHYSWTYIWVSIEYIIYEHTHTRIFIYLWLFVYTYIYIFIYSYIYIYIYIYIYLYIYIYVYIVCISFSSPSHPTMASIDWQWAYTGGTVNHPIHQKLFTFDGGGIRGARGTMIWGTMRYAENLSRRILTDLSYWFAWIARFRVASVQPTQIGLSIFLWTWNPTPICN